MDSDERVINDERNRFLNISRFMRRIHTQNNYFPPVPGLPGTADKGRRGNIRDPFSDV